MRDPIQARLETLKKELEKGQAELQKVEAQRTYLHESVLRISGAVQVLEELLDEAQPAGQKEAAPSEKLPSSTRADGANA
jgi:predicted nuclease with TOPRIM domain